MDGFGASITDSSATVLYRLDPAAPRAGDAQPVRSGTGHRGQLPAPADRRLGLHRRAALHLRRRARRADRLRAGALLDRARPGADPAAAAPGQGAQPAAEGDRHAVEPAGVDEDHRLADRRPAEGRPRASTTPTRGTSSSSSRPTRRAGVPVDCLTVQNEPQNRKPNAYPGMDCRWRRRSSSSRRWARRCGRRACGPRSSATTTTGPTHPGDIATTPPGEDPETDYPYELLDSAGRQVGRRHRVPLLLRRPEPRRPPCTTRYPGQGDLVHRVLRFARPDRPAGRSSSADTLKWHARNLMLGTTRNWAKSAVNWNIALDADGRPAQRRLRHLHRRCSRSRPDGTVTTERRVLHDRAPRASS